MASMAWPTANGGARRFGHVRSLSAVARSSGPNPSSSSPVSAMATERPNSASPLHNRPLRSYSHTPADDHDLSTIPDPRSRAMSPAAGEGSPTEQHPDLDNEVAALSNKLINAINHQTSLDDSLSSTRLELSQSQQKVRALEEQIELLREMLAGDVWIRRKQAETEKTKVLASLALEKKLRLEQERERKKIELELESLSTALFEEANRMVIDAKEQARREQEAFQHKNDLLKAQLEDTEGLLKSQQEQLSELKHVMETMNAERDDQTAHTGPSSPGFSRFSKDGNEPGLDNTAHSAVTDPIPLSPSYPTSFSHLLQPVLNTDLAAFHDFKDLLRVSKRLSGRRVSTGSQAGGLASLGLSHSTSPSAQFAGSTSSISTAGTPVSQSSPQTPNTPASTASIPSTTAPANLPPLKDTKFYKRALVEDIEPTLRLDIAPGLSWLNRRNVLAAISDGSLVVEPVPTTMPRPPKSKPPQHDPCSLCGEARKDEAHLRNHRFRTSESESAQRYPLCKYCLGRLRSTCDYLSFLRIVKDGHWHAEDEDAEKAAWEESVRLREQMFWSRIGGGVVPATAAGTMTNQMTVPTTPITPAAPATITGGADTDASKDEQSDQQTRPLSVTAEQTPRAVVGDEAKLRMVPESGVREQETKDGHAGIEAEKAAETSNHTTPKPDIAPPDPGTSKRLSLTIPGAFESTP